MKHRARVFAVVVLLVFGGACFSAFFICSHAVPLEGFDRVGVGMTEAQVKDMIGVPQNIRHDRPDSTAFFYGGLRRLKWCSMEVYFAADGSVTGKFHDH